MERDDATNHHVYTHPGPLEHWRHFVEIVAIIIAAVWGFYVFVYQERIKPSHERPVADISVAVSRQPLHGDKELVSVVLRSKNIGSVPLQVDGDVINVEGIRYTDRVTTRILQYSSGIETLHTLGETPPTLLATLMTRYKPFGGRFSSGYAPGREKHTSLSFAVKRDAYDAVSVDYGLCYRRLDDARHINYTPPRAPDGAYDVEALISLQGTTSEVCLSGSSPIQAL